jgi:hypothetical protein
MILVEISNVTYEYCSLSNTTSDMFAQLDGLVLILEMVKPKFTAAFTTLETNFLADLQVLSDAIQGAVAKNYPLMLDYNAITVATSLLNLTLPYLSKPIDMLLNINHPILSRIVSKLETDVLDANVVSVARKFTAAYASTGGNVYTSLQRVAAEMQTTASLILARIIKRYIKDFIPNEYYRVESTEDLYAVIAIDTNIKQAKRSSYVASWGVPVQQSWVPGYFSDQTIDSSTLKGAYDLMTNLVAVTDAIAGTVDSNPTKFNLIVVDTRSS